MRALSCLYRGGYRGNLNLAYAARVPSWGSLKDLTTSKEKLDVFSSNLTVTWSGFCYVFHFDNHVDSFTTSGVFYNMILRKTRAQPILSRCIYASNKTSAPACPMGAQQNVARLASHCGKPNLGGSARQRKLILGYIDVRVCL